MPYRAKDAKRFTKKAKSSKRQRQWKHVYDSAIKRGASESSAIQQASGVVKKSTKGGRTMDERNRRGRKRKGKKR